MYILLEAFPTLSKIIKIILVSAYFFPVCKTPRLFQFPIYYHYNYQLEDKCSLILNSFPSQTSPLTYV